MRVTYLAAKEQRIPPLHPWPTWWCSLAEVASVAPWRRTVRTLPWCCFDPKSSPSSATSLSGSGTTPNRTTSRRNVSHGYIKVYNNETLLHKKQIFKIFIHQTVRYFLTLLHSNWPIVLPLAWSWYDRACSVPGCNYSSSLPPWHGSRISISELCFPVKLRPSRYQLRGHHSLHRVTN